MKTIKKNKQPKKNNMQEDYEWQIQQNQKKNADKKKFQPNFGPIILNKNSQDSCEALFQIYSKEQDTKIYLIGPFNNWSTNEEELQNYKFTQRLQKKILKTQLKHNTPYKILIITPQKKIITQDPASQYFDDEGNSIFWDFEHKNAYKKKYELTQKNQALKIIQTDLPGLIVHFKNKEGITGSQIPKKKIYEFIAKSGVIQKIKQLGFNAIQFLPFQQSIDGDNWKFRYLVPFQYSIQKNWGTPDEFLEMIDEFHKENIAVIGDFVLGHLPYKDYQIFGQTHENNGIHTWKNPNQSYVYLDEETNWGTKRIQFKDQTVRQFFQESLLFFQQKYSIDGFRIDNVDGILRHGENGEGQERQGGREFLRELNQKIYENNPNAIISFEAHYFFEDNAKKLVAPIKNNTQNLGATAYCSSRLTYWFHTKYMLKRSDEISAWTIKHISEEKEWGKSNSTIADFHNHDAAAGLMSGRATGSFAYDAMTHQNPNNHIHAIGKIKVMEAIISFATEGRTLNLLQTFLLQKGTFEHDSSIQWHLENKKPAQGLINFKTKINQILNLEEFNPQNTNKRQFLNIDDTNKVIIIKRSKKETGYIIIINLSSTTHKNYSVCIPNETKEVEVILNSDSYEFSGLDVSHIPKKPIITHSQKFEFFNKEIQIPILAGYQIIILKEK